jgi:hypothetical protein
MDIFILKPDKETVQFIKFWRGGFVQNRLSFV